MSLKTKAPHMNLQTWILKRRRLDLSETLPKYPLIQRAGSGTAYLSRADNGNTIDQSRWLARRAPSTSEASLAQATSG
jgi:hypothetical protein